MDESFHTLEAELKDLPLPRPSAALLHRLEADLATGAETLVVKSRRYTTSTNLASWKWSAWRVAGLAAAVALVVTAGLLRVRLQPQPISDPATAPMIAAAPIMDTARDHNHPIAATNVLYELKDEGPVNTSDATLTRRVRARYLDTYTWKNPTTNASLRWSVPRDEIRLVSATLN